MKIYSIKVASYKYNVQLIVLFCIFYAIGEGAELH